LGGETEGSSEGLPYSCVPESKTTALKWFAGPGNIRADGGKDPEKVG